MTFPLTPAPSLSAAARPYTPQPLPDPGPDHAEASRMFGNGAQQAPILRERDLRERELLGMAMAGGHGVSALRDLRPEEFAVPTNQNVARAILDLTDAQKAHDAPAVTAELRTRGQLPGHLDPTIPMRVVDPRTYGLGAWQTSALAPETRAPILAREIRSLHRMDKALHLAHTALKEYRHGLVFDEAGRMEADQLGSVTRELAEGLVSLPRELHPEFGHDVTRSEDVWNRGPQPTTTPPRSLDLPSPPTLSASGRRVIGGR